MKYNQTATLERWLQTIENYRDLIYGYEQRQLLFCEQDSKRYNDYERLIKQLERQLYLIKSTLYKTEITMCIDDLEEVKEYLL